MMFQADSLEQRYLAYWQQVASGRMPHDVEINGRSYHVATDVFSPDPELTQSSTSVLNEIGTCRGLNVLDVGTGCGVLAIEAALSGAEKVTALDNSADAIACAKENAVKHGVADKIEFVRCDLLSGVGGSFDLIVANLPIYMDGGGRSMIETFLRTAKTYLNPRGRLMITTASFGNPAQLETLLENSGYQFEFIASLKFGVEWRVYSSRLR